jgi:hypothetical protein
VLQNGQHVGGFTVILVAIVVVLAEVVLQVRPQFVAEAALVSVLDINGDAVAHRRYMTRIGVRAGVRLVAVVIEAAQGRQKVEASASA